MSEKARRGLLLYAGRDEIDEFWGSLTLQRNLAREEYDAAMSNSSQLADELADIVRRFDMDEEVTLQEVFAIKARASKAARFSHAAASALSALNSECNGVHKFIDKSC